VITCTVHIVTKPTEHDRFVTAVTALRDATVLEDGNLEYSLWSPMDGSSEVLVLERWKDQPAIDLHSASEHMATFRAAVKGAVAAAPVSTRSEQPDGE
jgi:quinol monooxygenase YgiN